MKIETFDQNIIEIVTPFYDTSKGKESGFFDHVMSNVKDLKINSAIRLLEREADRQRSTEEKKELERIRETYSLMTRYLTTGAPDPSRADMTAAICRDILAMADRLEFAAFVAESAGSYYSSARVLSHRRQRLSELIAAYDKAWLLYSTATSDGSYEPDLTIQYEETLQELFRAVMATPPGRLTDNDVKMLVERASDTESDFTFSSQIVSALMLGLLEHYDRNRMIALISIYDRSEEERIQAQALVALALAIRYHSDRLRYDKELDERLNILTDDLTLYPRLRDIFHSLLQTQDTKRFINYFQSTILPRIQQMKPEELKNMMEASLSEDGPENPEWAENLENSELGKKLRKLNDMQFEGGDAFVMAFSHLKMFSFFGSPGNWVLPFDSNHSVVRKVASEELQPVIEFLEQADMMCDSDKYSFILAVNGLPSEQRSMMITSMASNLDTLREQMEANSTTETRFKREVVRYLRNLYRLFTLSSKLFGTKRHTPADPVALLETSYDILNLPYIGELLCQQDVLEVAAEFNFKRKNFEIATPLLLELLKLENVDTGRIWEQLGYIHESIGLPEKALDYYRKAELMKPENKWLLTHIAKTLEVLGRFQEAIEIYKRIPDEVNPAIAISLGLLYLKVEKYAEALQIFNKLKYEISEGIVTAIAKEFQPDPQNPLSPSQLANFWVMVAELAAGEYEKSSKSMPMNLPESFSAYYILFSFLERNYSLTVDGLRELENRERRIAVTKVIALYEPGPDILSSRRRLQDFFTRHILGAGANLDDFRLLLDSAATE